MEDFHMEDFHMEDFHMEDFHMEDFHMEDFHMEDFHMEDLQYCRFLQYCWSQQLRVLRACKLYSSRDYLYGTGLYGSSYMRMLG
jgi:hypothetical protein